MSGSSGKGVPENNRRQSTGKQRGTDRIEGVSQPAPQKGGILNALRRSPLVGEDLIPRRPFETGRKVDL